jgi:hypothetical protein
MILLLLSILCTAASSACPDLTKYRSPTVLKSFDPARMTGLWYESAYIDIAQVGASCQTLNATYNDTSGRLTMPFAVKYGPVPFTIVELYDPQNQTGMYLKHVNMPGGKLLQLDTVIVDVTAKDATSPYETVMMVSCVSVGIPINEVVFAMRKPLDSSNIATLRDMETVARNLGVSWNEKQLKLVNRTASKC